MLTSPPYLQSFSLLPSCGTAVYHLAAPILRLFPGFMFSKFPIRAFSPPIAFLYSVFAYVPKSHPLYTRLDAVCTRATHFTCL